MLLLFLSRRCHRAAVTFDEENPQFVSMTSTFWFYGAIMVGAIVVCVCVQLLYLFGPMLENQFSQNQSKREVGLCMYNDCRQVC